MRLIKTEEAVGHVLCHDLTRIVPGEYKGTAFQKGHVVREEDIDMLLSMGKRELYVWEVEPGMLQENEAAEVLRGICQGESMRPTEVSEGKIELIAESAGLFAADIQRLRQINSLGEMMIATRSSLTPVHAGDKLAGMRVIPLVIAQEKMQQAKAIGGGKPLLALHLFQALRVGVINTGSEVFSGRIQDAFTPVLEGKLAEYGSAMAFHQVLSDEHEPITQAIVRMVKEGAQMVLCTGGMSVDPDDRTPLAIKNTGAAVVSYGAPVLPGAMFMLAYLGEVPIVGLPGCVMYAKRTIFDLVLPRLLAGVRVSAEDLAGLGNGGLCLGCEPCTFPNCGFGKGV